MSTERPFDVPIYPLIEWIMQDKQRMIRFAEAVAAAIRRPDHTLAGSYRGFSRSKPIPTESDHKTDR